MKTSVKTGLDLAKIIQGEVDKIAPDLRVSIGPALDQDDQVNGTIWGPEELLKKVEKVLFYQCGCITRIEEGSDLLFLYCSVYDFKDAQTHKDEKQRFFH